MTRQVLAAGFVAAVLAAIAAAPSFAASCRQIEAQLASLPSGKRASPAQVGRYDAAIERQRQQMARARSDARRAGCNTGGTNAFCGQIGATLARMDANLTKLQRQRARLAASGDAGRKRAQLTAALKAGNCRTPRTAAAPTSAGPSEAAAVRRATQPRPHPPAGKLRTMCVRICDGYYFPISWSVSPAAFGRDGRACQAMCPGTQVELHYHRVAGEDSHDMVSAATGLPYREMPTAFLYRKPGTAVPAACGCGAAAQQASGFSTIGGDYDSNDPAAAARTSNAAATGAIPRPLARPDPAEDPETLASREGGLDATTLKRLATPPAPAPLQGATRFADPAQRQVRVVGPRFLPGPEAAADRPVPDPARGP